MATNPKPRSRSAVVILTALGISFGMCVVIAFFNSLDDGLHASTSKPVAAATPVGNSGPGSVTAMARAAMVGNTKDDLSEIVTLSVADDRQGLVRMVLRGRAFVLEAGTQVRVIDVSWAKTRVRAIDGPLAGRDGWTTMESVR